MEQRRLWEELPAAEPTRPAARRRPAAPPAKAATLPLWTEPAADEASASGQTDPIAPGRSRPRARPQAAPSAPLAPAPSAPSAPPAPAAAPPAAAPTNAEPPSLRRAPSGRHKAEPAGPAPPEEPAGERIEAGALRAAHGELEGLVPSKKRKPGEPVQGDAQGRGAADPPSTPARPADTTPPTPTMPTRPASPLRPPPAAPASRQRPPAPEPDMDTIADSLEELFEAGGQPAKVLRPFVEACPPTTRWEQPDAFEPSPSSYAQALREVLAGRRRIRIAGPDGAVLAVRAAGGEWSVEPATP